MRCVIEVNLIRAAVIFALAFCIPVNGSLTYAQSPKPSGVAPAAKNALRLPTWLTKADLSLVVKPFEEAMAKGGKLTMQLPKALERELALARNANNRRVVIQRAGVAAMPAIRVAGNQQQQMEQQIKAMIPQYRNQFINVLYGELQAVRTVCDVPKEARGEVYKVAEEAYDKALEKYVRAMFMPNNGNRSGSTFRSSVRGSLLKVLEAKLPAEEFGKLSKEVRERSDLRKRVSIGAVVSRLDETLRLTKEQREKITESIRGAWSDDWESWLMLWQYEDTYMPQVDDSLIATHLTPPQRRIWQQMQKISLSGEMHSEFAGAFDSDYWGIKVDGREGGEIQLLRRAR